MKQEQRFDERKRGEMAVELPEALKGSLTQVAFGLLGFGALCAMASAWSAVMMGLSVFAIGLSVFAFVESRALKLSASDLARGEADAPLAHASPRADGRVTERVEGAEKTTSTSKTAAPLQLQRAKLDGAKLDGLNLRGASLMELSAVGADLRRAMMEGANFAGADLTDVNLAGASLDEVNLSRATLDGANLSGIRATQLQMQGASLQRARLSKSALKRCDLREIKGAKPDLSATQWEHVNVTGSRLERADLRQCRWDEVDLRHASWLECKLQQSAMSNLMARGVRMPGCTADGGEFIGADFRDALMFKSSFVAANLSHSLWDGADLREADLSQADLSGASIKGANLSGANLSGANLSGANLLDTDLSSCLHNMLTTWPEGLKPEQLSTSLDEASLSEIVDEVKASRAQAEPSSAPSVEPPPPEAQSNGAPQKPVFRIKSIPKIHLREPSRSPEKTVPLDERDLHFMQEALSQASGRAQPKHASPSPLSLSDLSPFGDEEDEVPSSFNDKSSDDESQ